MNLQDIITALDLELLTQERDFSELTPTGGYAADLLSCVMAGASHGGIWVTLQAHPNIVAVAALLELSAVIITQGAAPEPVTIARANEAGVTLLATPKSTFAVVGQLWSLGVREATR